MQKRLPFSSLFCFLQTIQHKCTMTRKVFIFGLTALFITVCSCQTSDKKLAKQVAYEYEQALGNYDLDQAARYATAETIAKTIPIARKMVAAVSRENIEANMPAKIKITKVKITSDTTATAYWKKKTPIKKNSGTLELRKRNGVWQAHDMIKTMPGRRK